jgi:hypothetical protein
MPSKKISEFREVLSLKPTDYLAGVDTNAAPAQANIRVQVQNTGLSLPVATKKGQILVSQGGPGFPWAIEDGVIAGNW